MTIVVELYAGPGAGKSTTAAQLFVELKSRSGLSVEYVQEYIKLWAWENKEIKPEDQVYLTAKQARAEVRLYNKVDVIVTDAPVLFGAFYEHRYQNPRRSNLLLEIYHDIVGNAQRMRYQIARTKKYDPRGRYEDEEAAKKIDADMREWFLSLKLGELPYFDDVKIAADKIINELQSKQLETIETSSDLGVFQEVKLKTEYPRSAMEVLANPPKLFK